MSVEFAEIIALLRRAARELQHNCYCRFGLEPDPDCCLACACKQKLDDLEEPSTEVGE